MNDQTNQNTIKTEKHPREEFPRRISFLLRLWCVDETGCLNWRASLEVPETGKRTGFASLEQLFIYLIDFCESCNVDQDRENKE